MGIDAEKFALSAKRGDVSGIAINCAIGFGHVASALEALGSGQPIDPNIISQLRVTSLTLQQLFEELTGWTAD